MPNPKLFVYKARDAPVVVLLRRGEKRSLWEMILWNLDTDTFTPGQWLTNATIMNGSSCAISPDGTYFAYSYGTFKNKTYNCYGVISKVPYFTASLYTNKHPGAWNKIGFDGDGNPTEYGPQSIVLETKNPHELVQSFRTISDSGYIEDGAFVDTHGRTVTTKGGQLFVNGTLHYDTTNHTFHHVKYEEYLSSQLGFTSLRRSTRLAVKRPLTLAQ
jgi:hypothetical protein